MNDVFTPFFLEFQEFVGGYAHDERLDSQLG
jgi:hypothetical protein